MCTRIEQNLQIKKRYLLTGGKSVIPARAGIIPTKAAIQDLRSTDRQGRLNYRFRWNHLVR